MISNSMIDRIVDSNSSSVSAFLLYRMCLCFCPIIVLGASRRGIETWDRSQPVCAVLLLVQSCSLATEKEPLLLTLRNIWVSFSADPTKKVLRHLMVLKLMVCLEKIEQKISSLIRFDEKFWLATLENSLVLSPVDCFYYLRGSGTFCGKLITFSDKIFFQTRCVQIWSVWRLCATLEMFIY